MIVFMEYCDRGTIEEASKLGLPESMIRMYTREILKALSHLHDHGIVHRDLKGKGFMIFVTIIKSHVLKMLLKFTNCLVSLYFIF